MRSEGGTPFTLASRPFNDASLDMGRPPQTSRAYSRTGRAALAAGTLGTVGDDVAREDGERYVVARDANRDDADDVKHGGIMTHEGRIVGRVVNAWNVAPTDHEPREWYDEAERLRQSRLRRWQAIR